MRRRAREAGRAIALPAIPCPRAGRVPRVKSRPQAGPAGTRSALDAWVCRPVPAPATDPTPLRSTRTSDSARDGTCCVDRQNPPIDERPTSLLGAGSPVRYYVPVAPVAVASTLGAVITARGNARGRRWLAISSGCWISGAALTAYLVRKVNIPLFFASDAATLPPRADREALLRTWYRLNVIRIAAAGGALFATYRAKRATLEIVTT